MIITCIPMHTHTAYDQGIRPQASDKLVTLAPPLAGFSGTTYDIIFDFILIENHNWQFIERLFKGLVY